MEEKGADFNGESILQRKFLLSGPVFKVNRGNRKRYHIFGFVCQGDLLFIH